jgi:hypothetical protein
LIVFLSREIRQPIVDQTGLGGRYDYFLDINAYATDEVRNQGGPPVEAPSIVANALKAQLGPGAGEEDGAGGAGGGSGGDPGGKTPYTHRSRCSRW